MRESAAACESNGGSSNGEHNAGSATASTLANDDVVVVVSSVSNNARLRDDGGKPEPCSSASPGPSQQHQRHFRNLHLQSGLIDSPLLAALSSSPPPPLPSSSAPTTTSTPLLKASLNSPPVAHNRVPTSAAATSSSGNNNNSSSSSSSGAAAATASLCTTSASSSSSMKTAAASCNGSVDLSMGGRKRRSDASPPSSEKQSRPSSEMYANLIMQLRQQNQATVAIVSSNGNTVKTVPSSNGSSRKERLKCQPSFQCPVCKKRFQRHIAMNAHFQNEHIASGGGEEKICKLCSHRTGGIAGIRMHLLREHQIDLERPISFLVEPATMESTPSSPMAGSDKPPRILQPAIVTVHLTSSPSNNSNGVSTANGKVPHAKLRGFHELEGASPGSRSSSASPAPAVSIEAFPVKTTKPKLPEVTVTPEDILISEHARDLSMRRVSMTPSPPVAAASAPLVKKKRLALESSVLPTSSPQWQCQHCNIVFPNQTLYFLHRGFHSESNPWRCNGCGYACQDMFDFNTHLVSEAHG